MSAARNDSGCGHVHRYQHLFSIIRVLLFALWRKRHGKMRDGDGGERQGPCKLTVRTRRELPKPVLFSKRRRRSSANPAQPAGGILTRTVVMCPLDPVGHDFASDGLSDRPSSLDSSSFSNHNACSSSILSSLSARRPGGGNHNACGVYSVKAGVTSNYCGPREPPTDATRSNLPQVDK